MNSDISSQSSANPFQAPPAAAPLQRNKSVIWIIGIGLLASMCLCGGPCVALMGVGVYQAVTQRDDIEQVVDACMKDVGAHNSEAAFKQWSKRAIEHDFITREKLEKLAEAREFQDVKEVHVTNINVSAAFNSNPKAAQGTVANVTGTIDYSDGRHGTFQATLEKDSGEWRLYSLRVNRQSVSATEENPGQEEN